MALAIMTGHAGFIGSQLCGRRARASGCALTRDLPQIVRTQDDRQRWSGLARDMSTAE